MTALGRAFKLSPKLISLLAIGSSICGVSAIIAAKGAIDADDEDASYAMAAILALGAVSLFVFPLIGRALGMSDHAYGLWVGLAVDNTAEATAAGALYSDAAGKIRRAREDRSQRDDRLRRARLRALLGPAGAGARDRQQGRVPVAEVSEVRARLHRHLGAGDRRRVLAGRRPPTSRTCRAGRFC